MLRSTHTTPLNQGSNGRRWRAGVAVWLSVVLGFVGASSAFAVTDAPATGDAQATAARVVEFPMSYLWTDHFWAYGDDARYGDPLPVPVGRDTRTFVLDVDIEPLGPVVCAFGDPEGFGPIATTTWTAEEWSSDAPKTFAVPDNVGGSHYLRCDSGAVDQPNWEIQWWPYIQGEDVGPVAVLTDDEYLTASSSTRQYGAAGPAKPVKDGDIVRISGAPGTWPAAPVRVSLFRGAQDQAPAVSISDASVSADGSTVEFTMVPEPSPDFFGPNATFQVTAVASTEGAPRRFEATSFRAPLVFEDESSPDVAVTLSSRYALSFQRVTATAVIKPTSTGTVSFKVNGKSVGTTPLGTNGKAVLRLPPLAKGTYSITATFTPATGSPATVSPGAWLRVLY